MYEERELISKVIETLECIVDKYCGRIENKEALNLARTEIYKLKKITTHPYLKDKIEDLTFHLECWYSDKGTDFDRLDIQKFLTTIEGFHDHYSGRLTHRK